MNDYTVITTGGARVSGELLSNNKRGIQVGAAYVPRSEIAAVLTPDYRVIKRDSLPPQEVGQTTP